MTYKRQYTDAMLDGMQSAYGEGFLSPGGAEETTRILKGIAVQGTQVLDLGCGVGGATRLIAQRLNAAKVIGVDVEIENLRRANESRALSPAKSRIEFQLIEPGTLPFAAHSFDVVITKDVICHVQDKVDFFNDIRRVLRPGGAFCSGDWQRGTDPTSTQLFDDWQAALREGGLTFYFESGAAYISAMHKAGFEDVRATDVTEWLTELTRNELRVSLAANKEQVAQRLGSAGLARRIALTQTRLRALETGAIEHWHYQCFT